MKAGFLTSEFALAVLFIIGVTLIAIMNPDALEGYKNALFAMGGVIAAFGLSRGIAKNGNGKS